MFARGFESTQSHNESVSYARSNRREIYIYIYISTGYRESITCGYIRYVIDGRLDHMYMLYNIHLCIHLLICNIYMYATFANIVNVCVRVIYILCVSIDMHVLYIVCIAYIYN